MKKCLKIITKIGKFEREAGILLAGDHIDKNTAEENVRNTNANTKRQVAEYLDNFPGLEWIKLLIILWSAIDVSLERGYNRYLFA